MPFRDKNKELKKHRTKFSSTKNLSGLKQKQQSSKTILKHLFTVVNHRLFQGKFSCCIWCEKGWEEGGIVREHEINTYGIQTHVNSCFQNMTWEYYFNHYNYSKDLFQYQALQEKFSEFEEIAFLLRHRHSPVLQEQLSCQSQNKISLRSTIFLAKENNRTKPLEVVCLGFFDKQNGNNRTKHKTTEDLNMYSISKRNQRETKRSKPSLQKVLKENLFSKQKSCLHFLIK